MESNLVVLADHAASWALPRPPFPPGVLPALRVPALRQREQLRWELRFVSAAEKEEGRGAG